MSDVWLGILVVFFPCSVAAGYFISTKTLSRWIWVDKKDASAAPDLAEFYARKAEARRREERDWEGEFSRAQGDAPRLKGRRNLRMLSGDHARLTWRPTERDYLKAVPPPHACDGRCEIVEERTLSGDVTFHHIPPEPEPAQFRDTIR